MTKKELFDILQIGDKHNIISRVFDYLVVLNILLNITVLFAETLTLIKSHQELLSICKLIEYVTVLFFIAEYIGRVYTAEFLYATLKPKMARVRFIFSFDGIVDFLTIVPAIFLSGFVVFRLLRAVRILHLFRISKNKDAVSLIFTVLKETKTQLLSSMFLIIVLMLGVSLCMYSVENPVQPDVFTDAFSGIWWAAATVFTVGYGDIYPVTVTGRILAIITAFLGVALVALPTGILSAGFIEHFNKERKREENSNESCSQTG